jgi:hypothetical protein
MFGMKESNIFRVLSHHGGGRETLGKVCQNGRLFIMPVISVRKIVFQGAEYHQLR